MRKDPKEPSYTNLERVGILARRISHDLSNEMTCAVMTVSLLSGEEDLRDEMKDDIQSLSTSIERMGNILRQFSELLRERPFLIEPSPVGLLASELEATLKAQEKWAFINKVAPADARNTRVPVRVIVGILEEFLKMGILTESDRAITFSIVNDKSVELHFISYHPDEQIFEQEGLEMRVPLELIRQSNGSLTSGNDGVYIRWPLS